MEGEEESFVEPPFISASLLITKQGTNDALLADLATGDEGFLVTNVAMYDKTLAEAPGANGDWDRRSKYMGPRALLLHL